MNKKMIATLVLSAWTVSAFTLPAGAADKQVLKDEQGKVHNVLGTIGHVSGSTAEQRALNALDKVQADFGFTRAASAFKAKETHLDEKSVTHTKLDQQINGVRVLDHQMIVHEQNGNVVGITGDYAALTPNATKAALDATTAISKAVANTGYTGTLSRPAQAELVYAPVGEQAVLAYLVNVNYLGENTAGNWQIVVNATDGSILRAFNNLQGDGPAVGTVGTMKINTYYRDATKLYYMEDWTKHMNATNGGIIQTLSARNGSTNAYHITSSNNVFTDVTAGNAHVYAGTVYDYLWNKLGRNSYDNRGSSIVNVLHYSTNYNNAFWDGTEMIYGDGDGVNFRSMVALDVTAHELYHGVTETTANLIYSGQSGALNESWSDAFASAVDSGDWMIGEDVYTPSISGDALRYMDNPPLGGQPANMSGYVNTTSDNGGVHTNSGIPNKAFYNFATSIGSRDIAMKIWYIAERDYMTSSTNFSGARAATLAATSALYGSASSYYTALQTAWTNVGVN
ncbi:peptidase M4 family protein [Tumebacillus sp. ITR2]|uniref:Neutral metalloproteinase n=1 Tax=Tumebacillus amylolyticus TaxID=2801339 RepID=A0ABS1J564_9BACL|nr:M4 family metallopeptidase [Tumebacillus amylolyticus]MBL0385335.1 peptidase M4 family protein [Tumebacillus amylolyticus]